MDNEVDAFYKHKAKEITDLLFDKGFFADDVSRDGMAIVDDFIGYIIQSTVEHSIKCHDLMKKYKRK